MNVEEKKADATAETSASEKKECTMCGGDIPRSARKCKYCEAPQYKQQCVVCNKFIPSGARYCNECKSYQDWRRYFGVSQAMLALLVALISVLTPLVKAVDELMNWNSKTAVVFQSATDDVINITAMNTGRRPSILRKFHLVFNSKLIENRYLDIAPSHSEEPVEIVPPDGRVTVSLMTDSLKRRVPWKELEPGLRDQTFTLTVYIEESNGDVIQQSTEITATRIIPFIHKHAPQEGLP